MNKIKPENKKHIQINFLMSDILDFSHIKTDINYQIVFFGQNKRPGIIGSNKSFNDYKAKFEYALSLDSEYFVTIGEDLFMNNYVWDFIIENKSLLDNSQNLTLSPVINIGVPTCDFFIKDFCSQEEQHLLEQMFLKVDFNEVVKRWNASELSRLNKYTLESSYFQTEDFYADIDKLEWPFKGIHPVRFSEEAQDYLSQLVLDNIDKFLTKQNYEIISTYRPYLCNEMSLMKTDVLRKIQQEIGFDPYDELSINLYKRKYNLKHLFIKYGYALHTYFAYISHNVKNGAQKEQRLYEDLKKKIINA